MQRAFDVNQQALVKALAEELKANGSLVPPAWSQFVKTGVAKDRVPSQKDWWYQRGASMLRRMYLDRKPMGTGRLRRVYGDKEKNRYSGRHFKPASGAVVRKLLQQLEKADLIKKAKINGHYGRVIAPKGISLTDTVARKVKV